MVKGKVVLVPFPFDDLSTVKVRPAVCLTEPVGPGRHVVRDFITSQVPKDPADTDVVIDGGDPDFGITGLRQSSTLRIHRPLTVSVSFILRDLGRLPARLQVTVDSALRRLFGL